MFLTLVYLALLLYYLFCFRLYYLYEGKTKRWLPEETKVMTVLLCAGPVMAGLLATFYLAENLLHEIYFGHGIFFHGNYCANKPFSMTGHSASISLKVGILAAMVSLILEFFCQLAIFLKRTRIELKAEVYEVRGQGGDSIDIFWLEKWLESPF